MDRLTSTPFSAERVPGMTRLLKTLLLCACQAGINTTGEQMKRFVFWALYHAEQAQQLGLHEDSEKILNISMTAHRLVNGETL